MSSQMKEVLINGKWRLLLPEARANRPEWLIENGGWEVKRLESMSQNLGKGDVIYYIGAEVGDMAALCALWGADVVMFEPNSKVWPNIKAIWEANNLGVPACFSGFAANKTSDEARFATLWPESAGGEVIGDHGFKELRDPGDIPTLKIDDCPIVPTAIALDVEGSEWEVLKGAEQTLREYKPKIWLSLHAEFMVLLYDQWAAELRKWIIDLGYKETLLDYPLHEVHLYYEPL